MCYTIIYLILNIKYTFIAPNHPFTFAICPIYLLLLVYFILLQTTAEGF